MCWTIIVTQSGSIGTRPLTGAYLMTFGRCSQESGPALTGMLSQIAPIAEVELEFIELTLREGRGEVALAAAGKNC